MGPLALQSAIWRYTVGKADQPEHARQYSSRTCNICIQDPMLACHVFSAFYVCFISSALRVPACQGRVTLEELEHALCTQEFFQMQQAG